MTAAALAGFVGGLAFWILFAVFRAFIMPRLARARVRRADLGLVYRLVVATDASHPGSLCDIAHKVERSLPSGLRASFRACDDPRLEVGHVRVTFDVGTRKHRLSMIGKKS